MDTELPGAVRFPQAPDLCLSFANTRVWRRSDRPVELLTDYGALVEWSQASGVLTTQQGAAMLAAAVQRPAVAAAAFTQAITLREAIYRLFAAVAQGHHADTADVHAVNVVLSVAMAQARLRQTSAGFQWDWLTNGAALEVMLWPIARSTVELLIVPDVMRVKQCPGPQCGWLFLDTSRNQSRRWCTMKLCGNRARVQQHYQRTRAAAQADRTA